MSPLKIIKIILSTIGVLSLGLSLLPELAPFLALSKEGIRHYFYWQWLTYGLFEPSYRGISFSLFIHLGFSLYLLWIFGNSLIERLGIFRFLCLFLGSILTAGLSTWGLLETLHSPRPFAGLTPAVYTSLFAWTLLNARTNILLFFAIPFDARRAFYILTGITLFIDLSERNWPAIASLLTALAYTYLFIRISFPSMIHFPLLRKFEWTFIRWKNRLTNWGKKPPNVYRPSKIYDIQSGKPILNDEEFMDAMLTRISLYGEDSISPIDRKRMRDISGRKNKN